MFKIKICGITTPDDALSAAEAGADAIGLNFYEKSPRCVWPETARQIVQSLLQLDPHRAARIIGVSVNQGLVELLQISQTSLVMSRQLHGDESPALIGQLRQLAETMQANMPPG